MLAIVYLLLCALFGISLVGLLVPDIRRLYVACAQYKKFIGKIPSTLFLVPAGIMVGMVSVAFFHYYIASALTFIFKNGEIVLRISTLLTFAFFLWMILSNIVIINRRRIKKEQEYKDGIDNLPQFNYEIKNTIFFGIITVLFAVTSCFLMFYTFRISGNEIWSGFSTFSDFAPHTAMVSSFGVGFNFPTQYMHFSGDGIQYHFFFYFFCGMLEYMGLPLDFAINVPSIISMVCAFVLLGLLAMLISGKRLAYAFAPLFVLLRSSLNVFYHISELMDQGNSLSSAITTISQDTTWYEVTPYDGWGIWAINVYPNQRHLMLGVSIILILIILYLPLVRRMCTSISKASGIGDFFKRFIFSKNAWLPRTGDPMKPLSLMALSVLIVSMMPYFHGSALIAALLILFAMAIVSETRIVYLATAIFAVSFSFLQTKAFSGGAGNVVSFAWEPGFILGRDVSGEALFHYIFVVTGLTLIVGFICAIVYMVFDIIKKKPAHRLVLAICFMFPFIFAFMFKVSLEMLANHKFIQISLILMDAFVAAAISNLLIIPFKVKKEIPETEETEESEEIEEINETTNISEEAEEKAVETTEEKPQELLFGDEVSISETTVDLTTDFVFDDDVKEKLSSTETKETETKEEKKVYEHKPVMPKFTKGISLPAFITLQVLGAILGLALLVPLTATGISEWCTYINLNKNHVTVRLDSPLVQWIKENTDTDDVFLTPMWSMNRFFFAGRPAYYGWPYFAWSAGHDTNTRDQVYAWLVTGCGGDKDRFISYCKERHIRYVVFDPEFLNGTFGPNQDTFNPDFFAENLQEVAYFADDNNTIIYKVY